MRVVDWSMSAVGCNNDADISKNIKNSIFLQQVVVKCKRHKTFTISDNQSQFRYNYAGKKAKPVFFPFLSLLFYFGETFKLFSF